MVALCWIDNTGVTQRQGGPAQPVRARRRAGGSACRRSSTCSPIDDGITTSKHIGGPGGDLRLIPDLAGSRRSRRSRAGRSRRSTATPRKAATTSAASARSPGKWSTRRRLRACPLSVSFEVEWAVGTDQDGKFVPACEGPAYGMTRVIELSDYGREVVEALEREGDRRRAIPPRVRGRADGSLDRAERPGRRRRRQRAGQARRSGPYRRSTGCRPRSPRRWSPVMSATAGTCT